MKTCKKCGELFPLLVEIDGNVKNLGGRKFCLKCSPFGSHNTSQSPEKSPTSTIGKMSPAEFCSLIRNSRSRSEIFVKLGMRKSGASFAILNKRISQEKVNTSHFIVGATGSKSNRKYTDREVYCKNSKCTHIRERVFRDRYMPYACFKCHNDGEWLGLKLTLALDHINGDRYDNRRENLRWLCPNCHSQTETYCGRKKRLT